MALARLFSDDGRQDNIRSIKSHFYVPTFERRNFNGLSVNKFLVSVMDIESNERELKSHDAQQFDCISRRQGSL